jgi:hypothetical protein
LDDDQFLAAMRCRTAIQCSKQSKNADDHSKTAT